MEFSIVWSFSLLGRELVLFTAQQLSSKILQICMISSNISEKILRKYHSNILQVSLFIFCGVHHICPELASPAILQICMISSNISEKRLRKHHSNILQVSLFIFCGVRHICPELASPVILQIFMISSNISEKNIEKTPY